MNDNTDTGMESYWKTQVAHWANGLKTVESHIDELILFFEQVISHAHYPERAFFGTNKNAISVLIGHLYLATYIHSGNDKGIWMMVEQAFKNIDGIKSEPVKSTQAKTSKHKLFWLGTTELSDLDKILDDQKIWDSFHLASKLVIDTPQGKTTRERETKGRTVLTKLNTAKVIVNEEYHQDLATKVEEVKKLSKEKRKQKLSESPDYPERIQIIAAGYKRNPYVIIDVLERANGFCELCKKEAPFIRAKDESPFLEVHHIKPLGKGGKDTVENAAALCPNCHREVHLGINRDKITANLTPKMY